MGLLCGIKGLLTGNLIKFAVMKALLYLICALMVAGCTHHEDSLFRWAPLQPEADAIVTRLDSTLLRCGDVRALNPLVLRLESIADRNSDMPQLRARYYYWRAKICDRLKKTDSMYFWADKARMICDSSTYPYDMARINLLIDLQLNERLIPAYLEFQKIIDYALATKDPLLEADALGRIGVVKEMLDYGDASLKDNLRVAEIYSELGLESYRLRMNANLAIAYMGMNDSVAVDSLLRPMLENEDVKRDPYFYAKVLFDMGLHEKNPRYMKEAQEYCEKTGDHDLLVCCQWSEGNYYMRRGMRDKSDSIMRILLPMTAGMRHPVKKNILYDNSIRLERIGETDSALALTRILMAYEDSVSGVVNKNEFIKAESRQQIAMYAEKARQDGIEKKLMAVIAIAGVLLVALIIYIILNSRLKAERRRKDEADLELRRRQQLMEKGRREMMSAGLAMTEKDKLLQTVLGDIEQMEKERIIAGDVAQKIKTDIRLHFNREEERDNCEHILTNSSPLFVDYLRNHYPELTEGDIKMACYIQAGMTAKQIANMLLIQPASVKMNRHRLRSRLHLSSEESLEGALTRIVCQLESDG